MVRKDQLRLLLGTDAASEGLNLQRLGTLINFDLPWNPSRLEQRKGIEVIVRVDDPGAFTMPWKGFAEYRQDRAVEKIEENVCAENNRTFSEGATFGTIPQEETPPF